MTQDQEHYQTINMTLTNIVKYRVISYTWLCFPGTLDSSLFI